MKQAFLSNYVLLNSSILLPPYGFYEPHIEWGVEAVKREFSLKVGSLLDRSSAHLLSAMLQQFKLSAFADKCRSLMVAGSHTFHHPKKLCWTVTKTAPSGTWLYCCSTKTSFIGTMYHQHSIHYPEGADEAFYMNSTFCSCAMAII